VKKYIVLAVLLVLCLIPTVIAVASYRETQNAPVDEKTAVKLVIHDEAGKEYTFLRENGGEEENMILFFLQMQQNAAKTVGLPDSLAGEDPFNVTLSTRIGKTSSYLYYFTTDPRACYFQDPDGAAYQIAEQDAAAFIGTVYAESIYEAAAMPVLTLSGDHTVIPDEAIWQYRNYTGEYVDSDTSAAVSADTESYSLEGGFDLAFDQEPDLFSIKVTDIYGSPIYDGVYAELNTSFSFEANTQLVIEVTANWYNDAARSFCGELKYRFTSLVTAPAEFYLGRNTVAPGGFVAFTALNILTPEKIQFASEPALNASPVFYMEGDYAVGLLPISAQTEAGNYVMTFTYGGTTQNVTLTVEEKTFGTSNLTISASVLNLYRNANTVAAFEEAAAQIMSASESTRYFSGSFGEGVKGQLLRGFGREIVINGDQSNTYRNNGVTYSAAAGTSVTAANAGKVVFAGVLDYTGYMVVIDHGMGLKTWYYNMGSTTVNVGDMVAQNDQIGTCGDTGFTNGNGVHVAMSVGNQFVCPYDTWADSTKYGKVVIWGIDPLD